jgi:hypothetical protein
MKGNHDLIFFYCFFILCLAKVSRSTGSNGLSTSLGSHIISRTFHVLEDMLLLYNYNTSGINMKYMISTMSMDVYTVFWYEGDVEST